MKPLSLAAGVALLMAVWAGPVGADIVLLKPGTSNVLYLYDNDGTVNNAFGGGTTNQFTLTGKNVIDAAILSTGKFAFATSDSSQVKIVSHDGSATTNITLPGSPGYAERICSLPGGGFAVSTWYTSTTKIFFYDYDSGTDTFSVAGTVDFYALIGKAVSPSSNSTDLTLAGGQLSSNSPDVAFLGVDASNQQKVWFFDKNGEVAGTSCTSTLDSADAWIGATGTGGLTADPVGGPADSAVASVYQWPKTTDFALYTQVDTELNISDGVSQTSPQAEAWQDVTVSPDDPAQLLALSTTGSVYLGIYPVTLSGATASVGSQLIAVPSGATRIDASLPVPEPATMALLGLGFGGLAVLRRRRSR